MEFEWDHKTGEEGNPLRIKEKMKIASYLMLVWVLCVGFVVSERVLSAVTPKDKGRSSDDALQSNFHRGGTKEPISQQRQVERVPEESTCLLTLALSVCSATCLLIAVVQTEGPGQFWISPPTPEAIFLHSDDNFGSKCSPLTSSLLQKPQTSLFCYACLNMPSKSWVCKYDLL